MITDRRNLTRECRADGRRIGLEQQCSRYRRLCRNIVENYFLRLNDLVSVLQRAGDRDCGCGSCAAIADNKGNGVGAAGIGLIRNDLDIQVGNAIGMDDGMVGDPQDQRRDQQGGKPAALDRSAVLSLKRDPERTVSARRQTAGHHGVNRPSRPECHHRRRWSPGRCGC
jgi:hypothetical protein